MVKIMLPAPTTYGDKNIPGYTPLDIGDNELDAFQAKGAWIVAEATAKIEIKIETKNKTETKKKDGDK